MRIDMEDHPNAESFLAARLKCDISQVEKMMKAFPGLKKASVSKMKRILDYLLIGRCIVLSVRATISTNFFFRKKS